MTGQFDLPGAARLQRTTPLLLFCKKHHRGVKTERPVVTGAQVDGLFHRRPHLGHVLMHYKYALQPRVPGWRHQA